jgi:hypothetical protein
MVSNDAPHGHCYLELCIARTLVPALAKRRLVSLIHQRCRSAKKRKNHWLDTALPNWNRLCFCIVEHRVSCMDTQPNSYTRSTFWRNNGLASLVGVATSVRSRFGGYKDASTMEESWRRICNTPDFWIWYVPLCKSHFFNLILIGANGYFWQIVTIAVRPKAEAQVCRSGQHCHPR